MGGSTQLVDLPPGTWEEAQRWVGRELGRYRGADEVTLGDIRRRLHHQPLHGERDGEGREVGPRRHVTEAQGVHREYRKTVSRSMPTTSPVCLA